MLLIVIKYAQNEFEKGNFEYSLYGRDQKIKQLSLLVQEIVADYRLEGDTACKSLEKLRTKRLEMDQVLAKLNLPMQAIEDIYRACIKKGSSGVEVHNELAFMILFNALYLNRKGLLDVNGELFKRMMINVVGAGITYEMMEIMQKHAAN